MRQYRQSTEYMLTKQQHFNNVEEDSSTAQKQVPIRCGHPTSLFIKHSCTGKIRLKGNHKINLAMSGFGDADL